MKQEVFFYFNNTPENEGRGPIKTSWALEFGMVLFKDQLDHVTHGFDRFFWQKNSEYCKNCRFVRCMFVGRKSCRVQKFRVCKKTQIISRQIIGRVLGEACLKWPYFREIQVGEMLYLATNINTY